MANCVGRESLQASTRCAAVTLERSIVAAKEKELILLDRAAESAAKIIEITVPLGASLKELLCPQSLVLKVLKSRPMVLIGAGLCNDRNGRSACHPLFRIEIVCGNVDFLDRFRWRHINGVVWQPDEYVCGAIHTRVVVVAVGAVDVCAQSAFRSVGNGVLENTRCCTRHEINQGLKVPVLVQRHVQNGLCGQFRMHVGLFGLQCNSRRFHGDLFGYRANLQFGVAIHNRVGSHCQISLRERLEATRCHF